MATSWEIISAFWVLWKEIFHGSLYPTWHINCSVACCKLYVITAYDLNCLKNTVRILKQHGGVWEKTVFPVCFVTLLLQGSVSIGFIIPVGDIEMCKSQSHCYFSGTKQGHTWMQQRETGLAADSGCTPSHVNFSSSSNFIFFMLMMLFSSSP